MRPVWAVKAKSKFKKYCKIRYVLSISPESYYGMTNKDWVCINCNTTFKQGSYLKKHMRYICGKDPRFNCPDASCPYRGKKKSNLQSHIINRHRELARTMFQFLNDPESFLPEYQESL
nr:unnamed protein product [Callosobruchus analis]